MCGSLASDASATGPTGLCVVSGRSCKAFPQPVQARTEEQTRSRQIEPPGRLEIIGKAIDRRGRRAAGYVMAWASWAAAYVRLASPGNLELSIAQAISPS